MNWTVKYIKALNHFCFSEKHNDNCDGCIFKHCKKCPINTIVDKLEEKLVNYTVKQSRKEFNFTHNKV